jgi:hypothetical protein
MSFEQFTMIGGKLENIGLLNMLGWIWIFQALHF